MGSRRVFWWCGLAAALAVVGSSRRARAVPGHWDVMVEIYGWSGDCSLCHESASGGPSPTIQPFASSMKTLGLTQTTTRDDLLGIMYIAEALATDSDGDFLSDVQELRYAGDPNDGEIGLGELNTNDDSEDDDSSDDGVGANGDAEAPAGCTFTRGHQFAWRTTGFAPLLSVAWLFWRRLRRD